MAKRQDAPGQLELVRDFVNTLDAEAGADVFATAAGLRSWLAEHDLPVNATRTQAVALREAIRALAAANTGATLSMEASSTLDQAARDADVRLGFDPEGAALRGHGAFGPLLVAIALAFLDGTWARMRVCPNQDCQWMFYDHSKNRTGRWCQMAECGNRAKVRAYRNRAAES